MKIPRRQFLQLAAGAAARSVTRPALPPTCMISGGGTYFDNGPLSGT
jgi:hypothetical protein